jgi:hypothetical protein
MRIAVVDKDDRPLMPTTPSRARKWIESGKAVKKWADVDLTSGRKRAKSGKGFSAVMIGQVWMLNQLERFAPVVKIEGWQTASIRRYLGLEKNKTQKSQSTFETHAVDGVAIACSYLVEYKA